MDINYAFELFEFENSLQDGAIRTISPSKGIVTIDDFTDGTHFRTGPENSTNSLVLNLEKRLLNIILDQSGSMTWNDAGADRFTFLSRMLTKLDNAYPGQINVNLIGFGGTLTATTMFIAPSSNDVLEVSAELFNSLTVDVFGNSVFDFSGVIVTRRAYDSSRGDIDDQNQFPQNPADGSVVIDGIYQSAKDGDLISGTRYYYGIWTYNKNGHFSPGQFISGFPADRDLPEGVHYAESSVRVPNGIPRDQYAQVIYNFTEGSGRIIYDSSIYGRHGFATPEIIEENFWAGDAVSKSYATNGRIKNSAGVRFDGEYDIVETEIDSDTAYIAGSQSLTIAFWSNRYDRPKQEWVIGTSIEEPSNNIGWSIGFGPTGEILLGFDNVVSGFSVSTGVIVPSSEWNLVHVILNSDSTASVYLNGSKETIVTIPSVDTSAMDMLYIGAKPEDTNVEWPGSDYFGALSHISISNTARSDSYISEQFITESNIFIRSSIDDVRDPIDNGQREVVIKWGVGDTYNFAGGSVRLVRKKGSAPSHDRDGEIILDQSASAGEFVYVDTDDLIHNSNYVYRLFTYKDNGVPCDRSDARVMTAYIPRAPSIQGIPKPPGVSNLSITPGSQKAKLTWDNPDSELYAGTLVVFQEEKHPTVGYDNNGAFETNGIILTDTTDDRYVHRSRGRDSDGTEIPLINNTRYYYTIYAYSERGVLSDPIYGDVIPSSQYSDVIFEPTEVTDAYLSIVNPKTLSLQWKNPTVQSEQIDLWMGQEALIFTSIRDIFGGVVADLTNMTYDFFTSFQKREIFASKDELGFVYPVDEQPNNESFVGSWPTGEMNEEAESETILNEGVVASGLIKGSITHVRDENIIKQRESYTMLIRAIYRVRDAESSSTNTEDKALFQFNSSIVKVKFHNPIRMSILNKHSRQIVPPRSEEDMVISCKCNNSQTNTGYPEPVDGAFCNSSRPYVARIELQHEGEALTEGYPVRVGLYLSERDDNGNPILQNPPNNTTMEDGVYDTTVLTFVDNQGRTITKSFVDVEVPVPTEPETVDIYARCEYKGFIVEGIHTVTFLGFLVVELDANKPVADGIDVAEQFASVYMVNPDFPNDKTKRIIPPDGTLVKWEIQNYRYGRDRPFYSTDDISDSLLSGVYSRTTNGLARNVFFGPIGDMEKHTFQYVCDDGPYDCCIYEDFVVTASVTIGSYSASDKNFIDYKCEDGEPFPNQHLLINADPTWSDTTVIEPHYITWADGIHMVKFQIAKNPADPECPVRGAECFVKCVNALYGGPVIELATGSLVGISAPGEILWDVSFSEDPYTGESTIVDYKIMSEKIAEEQQVDKIAWIPIGEGQTTDFYIRMNAVIETEPKEEELPDQGDVTFNSGGEIRLPNEWEGVCHECCDSECVSDGTRWVNVYPVTATSTIYINGRETKVKGGGEYEKGIPPVFVGFREPLKARVIEARINKEPYRIELTDEEGTDGQPTGRKYIAPEQMSVIADGESHITFVVEASFAGENLPAGVPVTIETFGDIVELSSCLGSPDGCIVSTSGTVFTQLVNDIYINPDDPDNPGSVPKKSLAYFTINPLEAGTIISLGEERVGAKGTIIAWVDYDKRGDLET